MNDFRFSDDLQMIKELLELTDRSLAEKLGISEMTLNRWKKDGQIPTKLNSLYDFAFKSGLRLNKIKEQLFREDYSNKQSVVLFHGAKTDIVGELSLLKSREDNDFGRGFYCGESFEQSAMFVSNFPKSSVYILQFTNDNDLKHIKFGVDRDWMLTIAYYRKKIDEYASHPIIQRLIWQMNGVDYVIAPIADNRMFQIIDDFISGEITDIQCQHCLSATNLGYQYVFTTEKALKHIKLLRHCYLAKTEKDYYLTSRQEENKLGNDKVKIAKREYRGQGLYIDQILQ